ncbi:MAG: hypothetical protein AAF990_15640 [Bacteroidota bacterium]
MPYILPTSLSVLSVNTAKRLVPPGRYTTSETHRHPHRKLPTIRYGSAIRLGSWTT